MIGTHVPYCNPRCDGETHWMLRDHDIDDYHAHDAEQRPFCDTCAATPKDDE